MNADTMKISFVHILLFTCCSILHFFCRSEAPLVREPVPVEFLAKGERGDEMYPYFRVIKNDLPLDLLPENVPRLSKNILVLYSDYSKVWKNYILVYVINLSGDSVKFQSQDGDIYVKLEAEDKKSIQWVRAQHHSYSWCGNSYSTIVLPPKKFLVYRGMFPGEIDGDETRIRFRLYQGSDSVVSNLGFGHVNAEMVKQAKFDLMSIRHQDSAFITQVALGETPVPSDIKYWHSPQYIRFAAIGRLADFPSEGTVSNLQRLVKDPRLSDYFRKPAVSALGKINSARAKTILWQLLADTTISDDLSATTFEVLNGVSKIDALDFVRLVCSDRGFPHRYAIFTVLSNAFRLENEGERIENIYRTGWAVDSAKFSRIHLGSLKQAIEGHRKYYPSHYKFYLLDSALFQCITSLKKDLSDPAIKHIMTCYAEYKTSDLGQFLTSLYDTSFVSDSLKLHLQWLYEIHFSNMIPRLYVSLVQSKFRSGERLLIPLKCIIENSTERTFSFSRDSLIEHLNVKIKLTEHETSDGKENYTKHHIPREELFWVSESKLREPDSVVVLSPRQKYEFPFFFDAEKFIQKIQRTWYSVEVSGSWFLPGLSELPLTVRSFSGSFRIY